MARRDRGYLRFQRDRWVAKRYQQYRRVTPAWDLELFDRFSHRMNYLNKTDPWDCGNPQCGICHWQESSRQRDERQWRRYEDNAW